MIVMINKRNGNKTRLKNYQKLYGHLDNHHWTTRYNRPNRIIDDWFFACHSHSRIMAFHEFISSQKTNAEETTGIGQPVLEILHDRFSKPTLMTVTPDIDVESLREDWCRRYCEFHGYKLVEVQNDDGILHIKKR